MFIKFTRDNIILSKIDFVVYNVHNSLDTSIDNITTWCHYEHPNIFKNRNNVVRKLENNGNGYNEITLIPNNVHFRGKICNKPI
jgi:hypothetical protein